MRQAKWQMVPCENKEVPYSVTVLDLVIKDKDADP